MVNVHLSRLWFAPGGTRYRPGDYEDFPSQLLPFLPSSAVVNDGSGPIAANDWRDKQKKLKAVDIEAFTPNTNSPSRVELADPGDPNAKPADSEAVAGSGESESPASPKSSGPETQAAPGIEKKTGEPITPAGSKPADKKPGKIDL